LGEGLDECEKRAIETVAVSLAADWWMANLLRRPDRPPPSSARCACCHSLIQRIHMAKGSIGGTTSTESMPPSDKRPRYGWAPTVYPYTTHGRWIESTILLREKRNINTKGYTIWILNTMQE
jgi:hypothetical protein